MGKLTADFIAISKCGSDFRSRTFTQYEAREATHRINNATITSVTPHVPRRCVQITGTSFGQPRVWGFTLFYLFKHVGQYNGPSPKPRSPIRSNNCSGESGIPSENLGCSG